MWYVFVSSCRKALVFVVLCDALEIRGNWEWFSWFLFFACFWFCPFPLSWSPEAGCQGANSACEWVLFGLPCVFYNFELAASIEKSDFTRKKKIRISCFSWKIGRSEDVGAACTYGNNPQELSSFSPLWTGHVPPPHLSFYLLLLYLLGPSQDSTENEAPKIPQSLVLNHLPWPVSCSTSQHVPKRWRFWYPNWFPVWVFDSTPWLDTWHHSSRLPVLPASAPLNQEIARHVPCCWQPQNQATGTPAWFALTLYLSLLLFPTHHFFQGSPDCWSFNFVSGFHPWNHPLDLTLEFSSYFTSWLLSLKLCLWLFLLTKSSTQFTFSS